MGRTLETLALHQAGKPKNDETEIVNQAVALLSVGLANAGDGVGVRLPRYRLLVVLMTAWRINGWSPVAVELQKVITELGRFESLDSADAQHLQLRLSQLRHAARSRHCGHDPEMELFAHSGDPV
jgi:hypothetical protein